MPPPAPAAQARSAQTVAQRQVESPLRARAALLAVSRPECASAGDAPEPGASDVVTEPACSVVVKQVASAALASACCPSWME